jgi:hypothetical protein
MMRGMSETPQLIPLARAAALVYARLFPGDRVKDAKTLDLLAVAISARVPIYQQESEKGPLRTVGEAELACGRFTRAAARLEFSDRAPLRFLVVPRAALYAALDAIAADPTFRNLNRFVRTHESGSRAQ